MPELPGVGRRGRSQTGRVPPLLDGGDRPAPRQSLLLSSAGLVSEHPSGEAAVAQYLWPAGSLTSAKAPGRLCSNDNLILPVASSLSRERESSDGRE